MMPCSYINSYMEKTSFCIQKKYIFDYMQTCDIWLIPCDSREEMENFGSTDNAVFRRETDDII